jgi:hypothetical protein
MALSEFDEVVKAVLHNTPVPAVVKLGVKKPGITITEQPPTLPEPLSYSTYISMWSVYSSSTTSTYFKY